MEIKNLKNRPRFVNNRRLERSYQKFSSLITELQSKEISENVIQIINGEIEGINLQRDEKGFLKKIRVSQHKILKTLEKKHKIVPVGYYRNMWMVLGMSAFGIPLGVAFGSSLGNMGFLGTGLPIGMVIGIAVGMKKDNEAAKNGKQLEFSLLKR